jgi:hypothetical protein
MKQEDSKKPTFFSRVEDFTKLGLPVLGIIYVLGFIVVALNLSKYGVSPLSLVRVQYILAGIWLLLPFFALAIIIIWFSSTLLDEYEDNSPDAVKTKSTLGKLWFHIKKIGQAFAGLFGILLFAGGSLYWVIMQFPQSFGESMGFLELLKVVGWISGFGIFIAMTGAGALAILIDVKNQNSVADGKINYPDLLKGATLAAFFLFLLLGYIGFYSFVIYERIPSALGGGSPMRVRFMPKQGADNQKIAQLIKTANQDNLSEPYFLLFSTDKTLVVIDPNDNTQAIEISKDLIDAVIFNAK